VGLVLRENENLTSILLTILLQHFILKMEKKIIKNTLFYLQLYA